MRSYTRAINKKYNKTGSLFQPKTKAKNLNAAETSRDNYPLICFLYIHQNPIRAGLVNKIDEWEYSSFQDYSGKRDGTLCNKTLTRKLLDLPGEVEKFKQFSLQTIPDDYVESLY